MRKVFAFCAFLLLLSTMQAQDRYGHLNFGNLIAMMPETKDADAQLEAYQKDLVSKGEAMAKEFQTEYTAFVQAVQEGNLPPIKQQEMQAVLEKKQQEIVAYEQEVAQLVNAKRQELLAPIVDKAQAAVDSVAQANNFLLVFDTSIFGAVLYAEESEDLMPLVKAALGITGE
ncbi:MAG: OmpH family outer membrane protein [Bacteroidetes bacterium]|nr:MAG: OmpH family outer membrane protein [Bacteroidota bacterium]